MDSEDIVELSDDTVKRMRRYCAPGPIAQRFIDSRKMIRLIMGPVGSGKTSACIFDIFTKSALLQPVCKDGVARVRALILRNTMVEAFNSTINSWEDWFPEAHFGKIKQKPVCGQVIRFNIRRSSDGKLVKSVELEVQFRGLQDERVENVLRGINASCAFIDELDLVSPNVMGLLLQRLGRYPSIKDLKDPKKPTLQFITASFNAPAMTNWVYNDYYRPWRERSVPKDANWELFVQPSGFSAAAENLDNLRGGRQWYDELAQTYRTREGAGASQTIARMIRNEPGFSFSGRRVFVDYDAPRHRAAKDLVALKNLPILIGVDTEGRPAAVFGQRTESGRWYILDELYSEEHTDVFNFARKLVAKTAQWKGFSFSGCADPSGFQRNAIDARNSWAHLLYRHTGIRFLPAPLGNRLSPRIGAVADVLRRQIEGYEAFQLSPKCLFLHEALSYGYTRREKRLSGELDVSDEPVKNNYSHIADALQYLMQGSGDAEAIGRVQKVHNTPHSIRVIRDCPPPSVSTSRSPSPYQF